MLKHLSFNENKSTYLIQGQEFALNFHFTSCLFVLVYYNNGKYPDGRFHFNKFWSKIAIKSSKGTFGSITNVYHPEIKFISFGFGIKMHRMVLKINFLNTIETTMTLMKSSFKKVPELKKKDKKIDFYPLEFSKIDLNPELNDLEIELNKKPELNYKNFKLMNYESN